MSDNKSKSKSSGNNQSSKSDPKINSNPKPTIASGRVLTEDGKAAQKNSGEEK